MIINYFRVFTYLHNMLKSSYWNYEKLINLQNKKLRYVVKYAYDNVFYYHNLFKMMNISPDQIKTKKDLNKIPITKKDDIRKNYENFISNGYKKNYLKTISTSGSTGKPLFLKISQTEDEFRKAKHLRANISIGQKPKDKWVVITSPHHFGSSTKIQRFFNIYVPVPISVFNDIETQRMMIEKLNPNILDGYSSSLYLIAKEFEKEKINSIRLKFLIGGAELINYDSRKYIENIFSAPFYDHYSCIEFGKVAWQCNEKDQYHIDSESLILEFLKDNEEVADGETGEIICTSLFNFAMPLIRYAIGDLGIKSKDTCNCGRNLPLMKLIEGRTDSLLVLPNGRWISPRAFTVAISTFEFYPYFDQFRIIQTKINQFNILLKMKNNSYNENNLTQKLVNYLINTLSLNSYDVSINVKFVDEIPLDKTGKLMMVISELGKNKI